MENEASVVFGGEAGDGVRAAGGLLGRAFNQHGLYSFVREDYQSLIRGGHNFSQVRASSKKIRSQIEEAEVVVALDERSIKKHEKRLTEEGKLIFDPDELGYSSEKATPIPLSSMVEEVEGIEIMRNSIAIGAIANFYGLNLEKIENAMKQVYGEKAEKNISLAENGYEFCKENYKKIKDLELPKREEAPLLTGNQAISLGAAKAGLDIYIAYPMTPSTSILHFTATHQDDLNLTVVQPENEIGVINMALGSSYAGARSMIASSGGGFSLMQEAVSLSGMSETPILIIECQRAGPSTGVPTYTAQADMGLALNSGQGEFPSIVLAPGDPLEAFYRSGEALNLAWKHQVPTVLLSDKHLSESRMTTELEPDKISPEEAKIEENPDSDYQRYEFTEDGVSPLAFPGSPETVVKTTSYEHVEFGYTTEDPSEIEAMQDKRKRKYDSIEKDVTDRNPLKIYGDENSDKLILGWGSTKGAILEAMELIEQPTKFIQPIYLKPFPADKVKNQMEKSAKTICVENNAMGQLARLIREETLKKVDEKILKYDARPFNPPDLAKKLEVLL